MVSKPSFDTHESPIDVEGRHAAILNRDRRLTVLVGVYEADFARHAFTLSVLERVWAAKLEVERQAAREMAIAKQVQNRLFPERQLQTRTLVYADDTVERLGLTCTVVGLFDK